MTLVCEQCGNKAKFRRIYDATITEYIDGDGEERDGNAGDVNKIDDDPRDECEDCGSSMLGDVDANLLAGPSDGDYIIQYDNTVFIHDQSLLARFGPDDDARDHIRRDMDAKQFWPDVWLLDDHGGLDLIDMTKEDR
jgi:hypothetical protein